MSPKIDNAVHPLVPRHVPLATFGLSNFPIFEAKETTEVLRRVMGISANDAAVREPTIAAVTKILAGYQRVDFGHDSTQPCLSRGTVRDNGTDISRIAAQRFGR
jgi:hypothetical protein